MAFKCIHMCIAQREERGAVGERVEFCFSTMKLCHNEIADVEAEPVAVISF